MTLSRLAILNNARACKSFCCLYLIPLLGIHQIKRLAPLPHMLHIRNQQIRRCINVPYKVSRRVGRDDGPRVRIQRVIRRERFRVGHVNGDTEQMSLALLVLSLAGVGGIGGI